MGRANSRQPRRHASLSAAEANRTAQARRVSAAWPTVSAGTLDLLLTGFSSLDPNNPSAEILAMPIDYDDAGWRSSRWSLRKDARVLSEAEGPSGLRLPLNRLPPSVPRRALSIERNGDAIAIFIPPLLQKPFLELLAAIEDSASRIGIAQIALQGYTPADEAGSWISLGLAADPGVLEVNLPACSSWHEYADWIETVTASCEAAGLRSWKESPWDHPQGTGGGNHLLWGGPRLEVNPFFTRPAWLAAILRFWQHHPSLAYLFTGCYVGASSQAPRPDESARDLYDIEMAYRFLESLPQGDHRELINETLRHLQTDVTGNSHRSEMSFDKFWNTSWPAGALGLIEFRAIESLPRADWMSSVALLWTCLAAHLLEREIPRGLKRFGTRLHDEYFLPERLWSDFEAILAELENDWIQAGPPDLSRHLELALPRLSRLEKERCSPHRAQGAGELATALRDSRRGRHDKPFRGYLDAATRILRRFRLQRALSDLRDRSSAGIATGVC